MMGRKRKTMPLKAPVSGSSDNYELPQAGMTVARCVAVIDLGTHTDPKFVYQDGKKKGQPVRSHKVQIQFELDQLMEVDGEKVPMMSTMRLTLSANEKSKMREHLESWYGKKFDNAELEAAGGFDVEKLLGRPALLNIVHSDDGKYANVKSINPLMRGQQIAPQHYPSRLFSLEEPSHEVWQTLSKKTREFIAESEEVKSGKAVLPMFEAASNLQPPAPAQPAPAEISGSFSATDDDIPF